MLVLSHTDIARSRRFRSLLSKSLFSRIFIVKSLTRFTHLKRRSIREKGNGLDMDMEKGEETTQDPYSASSSVLGNTYLQEMKFYLSILLIKDWRKEMC